MYVLGSKILGDEGEGVSHVRLSNGDGCLQKEFATAEECKYQKILSSKSHFYSSLTELALRIYCDLYLNLDQELHTNGEPCLQCKEKKLGE